MLPNNDKEDKAINKLKKQVKELNTKIDNRNSKSHSIRMICSTITLIFMILAVLLLLIFVPKTTLMTFYHSKDFVWIGAWYGITVMMLALDLI